MILHTLASRTASFSNSAFAAFISFSSIVTLWILPVIRMFRSLAAGASLQITRHLAYRNDTWLLDL
jgi:hypothetical protein